MWKELLFVKLIYTIYDDIICFELRFPNLEYNTYCIEPEHLFTEGIIEIIA